MAEQPDDQTVADAFFEFIGGFRSAVLATVSAEGVPEASYAPVLAQDGRFYIYVSQLAQHTRNLLAALERDAESPVVSLLFIEPEAEARNLFARQRAAVAGQVGLIERESPFWCEVLDQMAAQFGETVNLIRQLPDFHLFAIRPVSATLVTGFAKAWKLEGDGLQKVTYQTR